MYRTDSTPPDSTFPSDADSPHIVRGPQRPDLIRTEILADLFEATAARIPAHTALIFGEQLLSYGELDQMADRAASRLIEAGVHPGRIVGLWLPRGLDLLVMQLAIAKTGAAWLPLDADTPVERVGVCLDDADAVGIVSCNEFAPKLGAIGRPTWTAEALLALPFDAASALRREGALPVHPAYVIYTSGSTGKPKGIAITQGSICHFLRSENALLGVRQDDRVYQGFSVAFDMSFEEIWISYLVGATLWIAPKVIASDPEALPRALIENQVSVLHAVPTLLALFDRDVPGLRIINLGGEMCPASLVERWAVAGRQVFNSYGPTEATVSASMAELAAGEPVTIGRPLPNYAMLVVAPEMTASGPVLLTRGEVGELCITGPGVAAGYLGRPELTAEKFLRNPWAADATEARLYRTGDLARIDEEGNVQCLGRTDDQIKIRGFRVELGEIEAVLAQQPGVGTVAVVLREVRGVDQLIAFLVAESAGTVSASALRTALAERLPPYMVPSRFEVLPQMPRLPSGKIDRKVLKAQPLAEAAVSAEGSDTAETPTEAAVFAAMSSLFPGFAIRRSSDLFDELGGHSLLAARLATTLRADPRFTSITVRDIYTHRTVGAIAAALEASSIQPAERVPDWTPPSAWRRWRCGLAQAAAIPGLVALRMMQWLAPFFTYHFYTGAPEDSIPFAVTMSIVAFLATTVLEFAVAIAGKWLIAGRLKPGRYPLWGLTYFRWWLADRLCDAAPTYFISGSSLQSWWLRALGARIGKDVLIGSVKVRAPDLLSVGDGASVGNAVNLENARVFCGELLIGPIVIGAQAHVGSYAVLEGNTSIGDWGHLDGQSALADGRTMPARRVWSGAPARDVGAFDPSSLRPRPDVSSRRLLGEGVFFFVGAMLVAAMFFLPVFPTFMLIDWLDPSDGATWEASNSATLIFKYFGLALLASPVMIVLTALISAGIRWSVLPRLKSGSWPVHSNVYCGKWLVNQIQESSLQVLHGVYATLFAPMWYRLLGAKVGRNAEISTALGVVPDMLTLGDGTFIADAVLLGDEEIDGGWLTMQPTVVGRRSFIGNGAYIPDGTTVPENVLIGVLGRAPDAAEMRSGETWLGSPALRLPAREVVTGHPESLTFNPSLLRRIGRGLVEAFRIVVPHAIVIAAGYSMVQAVMPSAAREHWSAVVGYLTLDGLIFGLSTFVFVALFKWIFLRRYQPLAKPMWTPFVWLSEAATNIYEGIAVPNFMNYLRGTPWLPIAFNLLGARIGRGVYLDTTDLTEFDCVRIGEYSELNAQCCPQTHLFEDRVMKVHHVNIGSRVNIGARSVVLYGAVVHDGAQLGPLTLVMKGESIPPSSRWSGNPAMPVRAA
ncbi:Pls/PosA family non-ribosomal peptide synthetase [Variovorax sp. dw_954]|uniref:Pls/PosA family non-ribosomal peptide synthetase n=1 Tax=Variovorax sp. dw_954 TaxID=2720078 RepID=UPI001BD1D0AC|nr:Pls/PosA family non-ribosomal peptide synthetase [Variovorax sp. dw_954]